MDGFEMYAVDEDEAKAIAMGVLRPYQGYEDAETGVRYVTAWAFLLGPNNVCIRQSFETPVHPAPIPPFRYCLN